MGENANECGKFADYYRSLCPVEWVRNLQFVIINHFSLFLIEFMLNSYGLIVAVKRKIKEFSFVQIQAWNDQRAKGIFLVQFREKHIYGFLSS
jgi:hypothetical protein